MNLEWHRLATSFCLWLTRASHVLKSQENTVHIMWRIYVKKKTCTHVATVLRYYTVVFLFCSLHLILLILISMLHFLTWSSQVVILVLYIIFISKRSLKKIKHDEKKRMIVFALITSNKEVMFLSLFVSVFLFNRFIQKTNGLITTKPFGKILYEWVNKPYNQGADPWICFSFSFTFRAHCLRNLFFLLLRE